MEEAGAETESMLVRGDVGMPKPDILDSTDYASAKFCSVKDRTSHPQTPLYCTRTYNVHISAVTRLYRCQTCKGP